MYTLKEAQKITPARTEAFLVEALISDSSQTPLLKKYLSDLNKNEIIDFFVGYIQKKPAVMKIPVSVFKVKALSSLELIVKYLKEELKLSNIKISHLLNRSPQTVFTTYKNSVKKYSKRLPVEVSPYDLPVDIFKERKLSTLEAIACFLKDNFELTYHAVALILNKDDRTVWTVYQRGKGKK